jgi:hypothetical protein
VSKRSNYEDIREKLRTELYFTTGSLHLELDSLLSFGKEDRHFANRDAIIILLGEFIINSKFRHPVTLNHYNILYNV